MPHMLKLSSVEEVSQDIQCFRVSPKEGRCDRDSWDLQGELGRGQRSHPTCLSSYSPHSVDMWL